MLKKLFYASASVLMLALAYHLGANTASAQAPGNPIVSGDGGIALTANGDVYVNSKLLTPSNYTDWVRAANVFGGATPAQNQTWGQLKATYRK
jgi:hypothetical protein